MLVDAAGACGVEVVATLDADGDRSGHGPPSAALPSASVSSCVVCMPSPSQLSRYLTALRLIFTIPLVVGKYLSELTGVFLACFGWHVEGRYEALAHEPAV